jgi:N-acetylglucosaminyl-diphospho-decaprenol L-rhamnosyltransferase
MKTGVIMAVSLGWKGAPFYGGAGEDVLDEQQQPILSIIIVNYNGGDRLVRCVESIFEHGGDVPLDVIVSDNASIDGSANRVEALYSRVLLLRNDTNLGLCKGFNLGLRQARGKFVLSLDNDTRVEPGALSHLIRFLESHDDVGAAGGTLLNPDRTLQRAARGQPSAWNAVFGRRSVLTRIFPRTPFTRRYLMLEYTDAKEPFEVDWSSLAAIMVRRDVLESVGGLDEDFFVYWSDADLCARIRRRGWKIFSVPAARIIHDESLAGRKGRQSPKMIVDFHKGAYRYYVRNRLRGVWRVPMQLVALAGLSIRAACIIGYGYGAQKIERLRGER